MEENFTPIIPQSIENVALPAPELVTFYKNKENRVLWLDSEVTDVWLEFGKNILEWNREDLEIPIEHRKPIKLMIFSYGGMLDINYALIDIIEKSKTPIIGINMGQACSAACFIFMACHKRFCMPRATFLIHQGGTDGGFSGTYNQVVSAIMEYQRQIEELGDYLLGHTKIEKEEFEEKFNTEWYITAEEAVKLGVCDKIVDDIDLIL